MKRFINRPPGARSRRSENDDYRGGAYFITTNTKDRAPLFGIVDRGRMYLNHHGKIVAEEWQRTGELRDEVSLEAFIVMPDHFHGILWITAPEGKKGRDSGKKEAAGQEGSREARLATTNNLPVGLSKPKPGSLSTIVGAFKSAATRRINRDRGTPGTEVWQSGFYDRIIRNRRELHRLRHYIRTNPRRWSSRKAE